VTLQNAPSCVWHFAIKIWYMVYSGVGHVAHSQSRYDLQHPLAMYRQPMQAALYVRLFITSLLLFQTRLCPIFQPLFSLRSWKRISFTLPFLLSLYSPIGTQALYLQYWLSFVFSSHTHFTTIHRHHSRQFFMLFDMFVSMNKWVINLFKFFRHYKSPPFHTVIRIHLISLSYHILVILPSHFRSISKC